MSDAASVRAALERVDDPEYPGVSIVALGMVHEVTVDDAVVRVELVPTYAGCPALPMIEADVRATLASDAHEVDVVWRRDVTWTPTAVDASAQALLGREFTVTLRAADGSLRCPACGSTDVEDRAPVGPARCRAVAWCRACRNVVEVLR